ncbi:MAG TPA: ATP synthase F0 subunit B [Kofleriaceae bacterium]|nr:ATP synthase F0 subunit B [Kofleriaceae bacterium]
MDQTVMGHLGGEAIIDIDWTAAVQLGLFLLLFLVCNALLFQPYLRLRARRREGIQGAREEATRMTAEADARLADYESKLATARTRAGEEQRKVRAEAAAYERETTDAARKAAMKALDEANAKVQKDTEAARAQLLPQAQVLAKTMASRILGREVA